MPRHRHRKLQEFADQLLLAQLPLAGGACHALFRGARLALFEHRVLAACAPSVRESGRADRPGRQPGLPEPGERVTRPNTDHGSGAAHRVPPPACDGDSPALTPRTEP